MASWKRMVLHLLAVLLTLAMVCRNVESHHGPLLIYKGGRRHGGAREGIATLLAAGAVAKLLQGHKEHHVHHHFVPVPVLEHGGHGW
ncbi:hypothetical protein HNY73_020145 [Argiope bruennichi]|uniref:Uncharacterized protein n=1 Tax=Argiope bruennichi TaxID=94029 RepID=A0A8T0E6N6_ARGBR|nr:hypothetical protein HNY73_020145 [Argiope bruennichi]